MSIKYQGKKSLAMSLKQKMDTLNSTAKDQFIQEIHLVVDQLLRDNTSAFLQALPLQSITQLQWTMSSLSSNVNPQNNILSQLSSRDVFQHIGSCLTFKEITSLSCVNTDLYINTHASTFVLQRRTSNDLSFKINQSILEKIELYDKDSSLMYYSPESITLDLVQAFVRPVLGNRHMDDFLIQKHNQQWWRNMFSSVDEIIVNQGSDYLLPYIPCDLVFNNINQQLRHWHIEFQHTYQNWESFEIFHQNFTNHAKDRHIEKLGITGVQNESAQKACHKLIETFKDRFYQLDISSCKFQIDNLSHFQHLFHSRLKRLYITYDSDIKFIQNDHFKSTCVENDNINIDTLCLTYCNRRNNNIMKNLASLTKYQILQNVVNLEIDWDIKMSLHRYSRIKQNCKSTLLCESIRHGQNPQNGWLYHLLTESNCQINISSLKNISIKAVINHNEDLVQLIRELRYLDDISIDLKKFNLQKILIQIQFDEYDGYTLLLPSPFSGTPIEKYIYTRNNQFNISPQIYSNIEMWLLYCGDYFCQCKNGFTNIIINVEKEMQMK